MVWRNSSNLPPGFRFHPTDEELIMCYLKNQANSRPCPVSIIPEIDIYKFDPWELPEKSETGSEKEWYFFSPRERKYPNGVRPNRAAVSGYWKATGTDKEIYSGSKHVGVKKSLVFYKGKPPKGAKTDWIMHEYRLGESKSRSHSNNHKYGSMRLDDWVLCRIYKKRINAAKCSEQIVHENSMLAQTLAPNYEPQPYKFPRACSLTHMWDLDCMASISQLIDENAYDLPFDGQETMTDHNKARGLEKSQSTQVQLSYDDDIKLEIDRPIFANPFCEPKYMF